MGEKEKLKKTIDELQQENEQLRKYKRLSKNDIALWDEDLEFIKMLRLQKKELKEKIQDTELLLVDNAKETLFYKNIIKELQEWLKEALNEIKQNDIYDRTSYEMGQIIATECIIEKIQELLNGGENEN